MKTAFMPGVTSLQDAANDLERYGAHDHRVRDRAAMMLRHAAEALRLGPAGFAAAKGPSSYSFLHQTSAGARKWAPKKARILEVRVVPVGEVEG